MAPKQSKLNSVSSVGPIRPSCGREDWPRRVAAAENAGILVVGRSARHGDVAAVLLGGRFYTRRQVYAYTDFGGGLDRAEWGQPQLGAFREFAEELLGLPEEEARAIAALLWDAAKPALLGGAPLVHKGYAMFLVPAEALVPVLQREALAQFTKKDASAIDHLLATGKRNSELTSLALVSVSEFLGAANGDGHVPPLCIRSLDGAQRDGGSIALRRLMVGPGGSVATCWDRLESYMRSATGMMTAVPAMLEVLPTTTPAALAQGRISIIFDMETGDPDDVLTLLFLAAHSSVDLKAVTITNSGSRDQVSLVRWLLREVGLADVRIGAQDWPENFNDPPLTERFYQNFGRLRTETKHCEPARQVLLECCDESTTLITGGPVNNLASALESQGFRLGRWVAQGGFAGQGVVPEHLQMDKFKGRTYNRTFNFGSDPRAAKCALASNAINRRICVSKNVCHRTLYDGGVGGWHESVAEALRETYAIGSRPQRSRAFEIMHGAMSKYLAHKPSGKMLHDPLALAVALDESTCALEEVQFETEGDRWGCWLCPGSGTWVAVDYNEAIFKRTLLRDGFQAAARTSAPSQTEKATARTSALSQTEKDFMKFAKAVRDILKIERQVANGDRVEATRIKKMDKRDEVLAELRRLEQYLPSQSDVRAKCKDVVALLFTDAALPLQQEDFRKEDEHASVVAMQESSVPGRVEPAVPTHAFKQAPAVVCAKIEPPLAVDDKEEVDVAHVVDDRADAGDAALRQKNEDVIQDTRAELDVPKQAPIVVKPQVEPQVAVDDEETDLPSMIAGKKNADGKESGKPRGKRGGVSHAIRKYRGDHAGA